MNRGYRGATMASLGSDSPAWTFGLNPKIPGPRVPGVGTYNIAGRLESDSVGTHFSRVGTKPTCPRADAKRLVFGTGSYKSSSSCCEVCKLRYEYMYTPAIAKSHAPHL